MANNGKMILPEGAESYGKPRPSLQDFPGPLPQIDPAEITRIIDTQLLVLGGGHAGIQVALAACEGGAQVAVIESRTREQMTWMGEQVGTFNSRFLTQQGCGNYNLDDIIDEFDRCSGFRCNHTLMAKYVRNSGEMLDHVLSLIPEDSDILNPDQWNIHKAWGNPTYPVVRGGYRTWAGTIQFRGPLVTTRDINYPVGHFSRLKDLCRILQEKTQQLGAQWYFGHRALVLARDDTGRVTGAIAKNRDGSYVQFRASVGVTICLGNFSDAGMRLGIWAGGHADNTPLQPVQARVPGDASRAFGQTSFLLLNAQGKRFVNESVPYALSPALERQRGGFVTMVTDRNWLEQVKLCGVHHGCPDFGQPLYIQQAIQDMSHVIEYGAEGYGVRSCALSEREQVTMYAAETLDQLADFLGYAGEAKTEWLCSIARYNEMCRLGRDEDFGKDPDTLLPVEQGPFYGCITPLEPIRWDDRQLTSNGLGGLHTDDDFRVLDNRLEPIPGLYAAGNCLGYRYSVFYPTPCGGNFIGSAMTLGRLLGQQLAADI